MAVVVVRGAHPCHCFSSSLIRDIERRGHIRVSRNVTGGVQRAGDIHIPAVIPLRRAAG